MSKWGTEIATASSPTPPTAPAVQITPEIYILPDQRTCGPTGYAGSLTDEFFFP